MLECEHISLVAAQKYKARNCGKFIGALKFIVSLDVVIKRCSGKKIFLKSDSSIAVKSSGGKNKSIIVFVQNFFYVETLKNPSCSKFLQNTLN